MSEQQREEKQSRVSSFSHKAPAQAAASAKGMPSIANALRAASAMPPRMRYTLACGPPSHRFGEFPGTHSCARFGYRNYSAASAPHRWPVAKAAGNGGAAPAPLPRRLSATHLTVVCYLSGLSILRS